MPISIIAAIDKNFVIGHGGQIPWKLSDDLKLFKQLTTGHVVIMGRKTYESLPQQYRPLPNRHNIVSSSGMAQPTGVIVCKSYEEALMKAKEFNREIFLIGGASVFERGMRDADKLLISHVFGEFPGDTFFPRFSGKDWTAVKRTPYSGFEFVEYQRAHAFKGSN